MRPLILPAAAVLTFGGLSLAAADEPSIIRVGIMESMSQATSPRLREAFAPEFSRLITEFTGLKSVILQGLDPFTAARQLRAGKWHLGVFQGVEYAWVQAKYPKLRPLAMAKLPHADLRALLVVKRDSQTKGFGDLKGKNVHVLHTKLHCRLFAEKGTQQTGYKQWQIQSGEDALDNVLIGKADAAVVDTAILKLYKDILPGRFKQLKVAARSERFPPPAIIYHEGTLSEAMLNKWRNGILKLNQTERGREALASFQITSFQPVPPEYQQALTRVLKAYPPPQHE